MEHVTRHLIYSRFWHHFLYDLGVVNTPEPYKKRSAQGMILGEDGQKMSKSRGNVIDPLDIVDAYGADTLRTYVLFMGDYGAAAPWSDASVRGCKRFLERFAGLTDMVSDEANSESIETGIHKTIKKVSEDIEAMKYNTAIAAMMGLLNDIVAEGHITKDNLVLLVKILAPFAPHLCEEMYAELGGEGYVSLSAWPEFDPAKIVESTIEIAVQVNGKLKATIKIPNGCEKDEALSIAKADSSVAAAIEGKNLVKEIYVPNKIVNLVVK
jgi:leucyl-tRNA synthetase